MKRQWLILGAGAAVLLAGNWYLWSSSRQPRLTGKEQVLYLYCTKCGFEMPCSPGQEQRTIPCPTCGVPGQILRVSAESHAGNASRGPNPLVVLGALDVNILMAVAVFVASQRTTSRRADDEPVYHRFTCRRCGRRLRYREQQAGRPAKCPGCKSVLLFPRAVQNTGD